MISIFTEHFWRHVWGPWSKPKRGVILEGPATGAACDYIERTCKVCGKTERCML